MSTDLTGGALVSFILSELRPVVARHPRFRANAGTTLAGFSNLIAYNDLSLTVTNVRANGDLQSPDAFVATLMGRAVHARLEDKPGAFIEWARETDPSGVTPEAGVYYFAVDAVNEATREVRLVLERYRWMEGSASGTGTIIFLHPSIPMEDVRPQDPAAQVVQRGGKLVLLNYVQELVLLRDGAPLRPGIDWWVEVEESHVLVGDAPGGAMQGLMVPPGWTTLQLLDQDDYTLRQGIDWRLEREAFVWLAPWTLPGSTIRAVGSWRRTPGPGCPVAAPENFLSPVVSPGEEAVPSQCSYSLTRGDFGSDDLLWLPDGRVVLKQLLEPGDRLRWEIRTKQPQVYLSAKKLALNPNLLPGLAVAIGDQVEVGDAAALIVFPQRCETYDVYGAKDGVSFDIVIKSNDLTTSSELASLVRSYLMVEGRNSLESAGMTVQRVAPSYQGDAKDASGTSSTHTVTLAVSGLADWEIHRPLINRVDDIDVMGVRALSTYPGKPTVPSRAVAFGASRFSPAYQ